MEKLPPPLQSKYQDIDSIPMPKSADQLDHSQESSKSRPLLMWCIGGIDLVSAWVQVVITVYKILAHSSSGSLAFVSQFFLDFVGTVVQFLQGLGLVTGLSSSADSTALGYCQFWIACQVGFVFVNVLEAVYQGLLLAAHVLNGQERPLILVLVVVLIVYRVTSIIIVNRYAKTLEESISRARRRADWAATLQEADAN